MALSTSFYHRDYFNEIRLNDTVTWEVAHPLIFRQLVSRRPKQWVDVPTFQGIRGTRLSVQTPLGQADVWVLCQYPDVFHVPNDGTERELWEWWLQWCQTPILVTCPIFRTRPTSQLYFSGSIRSVRVEVINVWGDTPTTDLLNAFLFGGCFTVVSGQTLAIALHRDGRLPASSLIHLLRKWRRHYRASMATADSGIHEDERWMMVFQPTTIQLIHYARTNTLVGDHPALYATYDAGGNATHPMVLTELFHQLSLKSPVLSHFVEYNHTVEPTLRFAIYQTFYTKIARPSPSWAMHWRTVQPYLTEMSVDGFRESNLYEPRIHIYPPPDYELFDHMHGMFRDNAPHYDEWVSFLRYLQSEYRTTNNRMAYYLFSATFRHRAPKSQLYTYWTFVQSYLFHTADEWMTWVCNLVVFYHNRASAALPWRFFHWLFSDHVTYPIRLFQPYPVQLGGTLTQQSLYDFLNLYKENLPATQIPYLYKIHVLNPRLQARLRVLYTFRRTLPASVSDVLLAYVTVPAHRDLLWQ